jgi:HK97 family phage major capsid protein
MEVSEVKTALDSLTDRVANRVNELESIVMDLARKSAPGFPAGHGAGDFGQRKVKSVGQAAIESEQIKSLMSGQSKSARVTLDNVCFYKAAITGDTGSPASPDDVFSQADRLPSIIANGRRPLRVADLLVTVPATSNQAGATVEGNTTNAAAGQTAEGAAKAESDFVFELKQTPIITIAHTVPASEQVLSDAPALQRFLDERMREYVLRRHEFEILRGTGAAGSFSGFTKAGNHTVFNPATGSSAPDNIRIAAEKVESADFFPTAVILHPEDWRKIELEKVTGGAYLLGDGNAMGFVGRGMTRQIWGLPVITSVSMQKGKFIVADFMAAATHFLRQDAVIDFGFVNDQFSKNMLTIRAEMRAALLVTNPLGIQYGSLTL